MVILKRDGHYGIESKEAGRLGVDRFLLALSYLIEAPTTAHFVIHVRPTGGYVSDLTSQDFMQLIGFSHFGGRCPFLQEACYYRYVFESPVTHDDRRVRRSEVEYAHRHFKTLAEALPSIYEQVHSIYTQLGSIPALFPSLAHYAPQPLPDFSQEAPPWIDEAKVEEHVNAERLLREAVERDRYYSTIEHILWGTGEQLEEAVQFVLEDMGFEVRRTPKGNTIDRLASIPSTSLEFGIEITGLNEGIRKKSNKIGQAQAFLQQRDRSEKPVILANTFNDRPLQDRVGEMDFTQDALELMVPNGIVGMTTSTLYDAWRAVKFDGLDVAKVAQALYDHSGGEFTLGQL